MFTGDIMATMAQQLEKARKATSSFLGAIVGFALFPIYEITGVALSYIYTAALSPFLLLRHFAAKYTNRRNEGQSILRAAISTFFISPIGLVLKLSGIAAIAYALKVYYQDQYKKNKQNTTSTALAILKTAITGTLKLPFVIAGIGFISAIILTGATITSAAAYFALPFLGFYKGIKKGLLSSLHPFSKMPNSTLEAKLENLKIQHQTLTNNVQAVIENPELLLKLQTEIATLDRILNTSPLQKIKDYTKTLFLLTAPRIRGTSYLQNLILRSQTLLPKRLKNKIGSPRFIKYIEAINVDTSINNYKTIVLNSKENNDCTHSNDSELKKLFSAYNEAIEKTQCNISLNTIENDDLKAITVEYKHQSGVNNQTITNSKTYDKADLLRWIQSKPDFTTPERMSLILLDCKTDESTMCVSGTNPDEKKIRIYAGIPIELRNEIIDLTLQIRQRLTQINEQTPLSQRKLNHKNIHRTLGTESSLSQYSLKSITDQPEPDITQSVLESDMEQNERLALLGLLRNPNNTITSSSSSTSQLKSNPR